MKLRYDRRMLLRLLLSASALLLPLHAVAADGIHRRDAFLLIWQSTARPAEEVRETPYADVPAGSPGFKEITFAKARSILGDAENFRPDDAVTVGEALTWIFRTRSVEPYNWDHTQITVSLAEREDVEPLVEQYGIDAPAMDAMLTESALLGLLQQVDAALLAEVHEASLYSEKFHGKGTAFGESFDMHALTAAHRSYPYNTLVRVTNQRNAKSVVVRINDRGPFVNGRDMDLSLASFLLIEERSYGKLQATFERLGDVSLVSACADDRYQKRITKDTRFDRGVPHSFGLGEVLTLTSTRSFVVRSITYPDGFTSRIEDWVLPEERYAFTPSVTGVYTLRVGDAKGRARTMEMHVVACQQG